MKAATSVLGSAAGGYFYGKKRPVSEVSQGTTQEEMTPLEYLYGDPADLPYKRQRRSMSGHRGPRNIIFGRTYRPRRYNRYRAGKRGSNMSLSAINNILFPIVKEVYDEDLANVEMNPGFQTISTYSHLDVAKVTELMGKGVDVHNIDARQNLLATSTANDFLFKYLGGFQKHTFLNISNHTTTLFLYVVTPRRYTDRMPLASWTEDLTLDDPITNAVAPIDVTVTPTDKPGHNFPFAKSHKRLNYMFRKQNCTKVVLAPGEQYVYTMKHSPFQISSDKMRMAMASEGGAASTTGYFTNHLMVLSYSQLVQDSVSEATNYGSGKVSHIVQETNTFRATFENRGMTVVNHGNLGIIANQEEHIEATDGDFNTAYSEL